MKQHLPPTSQWDIPTDACPAGKETLPLTPANGCVPHLDVSGPSVWVGTGGDSWGHQRVK